MVARLRRRLALLIRRKPLLPFLFVANLVLIVLLDEAVATTAAACLCFAAPGLLGVRASRSRPGWVGRLLTSTGAAGATVLPFGEDFRRDLVLLVMVYVPFVAAVAFLTRHALAWAKLLVDGGEAPVVQFSVRGLLIATTAIAVSIPLFRFLDIEGFLFFVFLVWSPLPIAACWINHRVRPWPKALGFIVAVSLATSLLSSSLENDFFIGGLLQGVAIAAWLLGLRVTLRTLAPPRKRVAR